MGTRWGYQGMVREILANLRKGLRGKNITLCATGGFAKWVLKDMNESFVFDPDLTLYGLGVIFDRNEEAT
jgi:pantothenate kinase type III